MDTPPSPPIITLLTDFGSQDYFVGSMKGAILRINPTVHIVDLTHDIRPFAVAEAAFTLKCTYPYFPKGTIHLAVVDPGVGSERRPLLVTVDDFSFLAPDNGLLSYVYRDRPQYRARELTVTKFHLAAPGNTFHGRDIFAPVAAWLSTGLSDENFGPLIQDPVGIPIPEPTASEGQLTGEVVYIDRFGNLITNITYEGLHRLGNPQKLRITIGHAECRGFSQCYAQTPLNAVKALVNSSGYLEIGIYQAAASARLNIATGAQVTVAVDRS